MRLRARPEEFTRGLIRFRRADIDEATGAAKAHELRPDPAGKDVPLQRHRAMFSNFTQPGTGDQVNAGIDPAVRLGLTLFFKRNDTIDAIDADHAEAPAIRHL